MTKKRPTKRKSRLGHATKRDNAIFKDLYHARVLSEEQLCEMHFPSPHAARNRMYTLASYNYVKSGTCDFHGRSWVLGPRTFRREAEGARRRDEAYRSWPEEDNLRHYLETNDVYVKIAATLDVIFEDYPGEYPAWEWKDEVRSRVEYEYAGKKKRRHEPDAEVNFGGLLHFIERQTERSKESPKRFEERCSRYRNYMDYIGKTNGEAVLLFACDIERDMNHGLEAAKKYELPVLVGTPEEVADFILERAEKVADAV